jgi:hypothetical protein
LDDLLYAHTGLKTDFTLASNPFCIMSSQITYSREYLRALPEQLRRQRTMAVLNDRVQRIMNEVVNMASSGKTQYMAPSNRRPGPDDPTDEEIVEVLRKKLPGCNVTYSEQWVEVPSVPTRAPTRELKTGIFIDWS